MCGITGVFHYAEPDRQIDREVLARMTRSIAHRGPDDEGFFIDGALGLGHRRLAIVDLTATGRQPMLAEDGCVIVYNGEAYNHGDYRPLLTSKGVKFRGSSDTETLLHLLRLRGAESLADIAGIFGLAFWNPAERKLTLARDPIGVKQVYFHDDGRRVVFASEIKALMFARDVPRAMDEHGYNEYVHFHGPLFERTFFRGIQQVRPGEIVEFTRHGARKKTYWQIPSTEASSAPPTVQIAELRDLLNDVVKQQLMSDVPVGAFFSGGIDSSAVAAYANDAIGSGPSCFGVHFADQGVIDEGPYQIEAARALGLNLELITVDGRSFPEDLATLIYHQDQPVVGPALIPMFHVSALARKHVKVCLGGQGADEVFGGYARHALVSPLEVLRNWRLRDEQRVASSSAVAPAAVGGNLLKQLADLRNVRRLVSGARYLGNWPRRYFKHFAKTPSTVWRDLSEAPVDAESAFEILHDCLRRSPAQNPLQKILLWEMQTYLPSLLQQDDRMSMANSLESRVPLADPRIVSFAFRVPNALKLRSGATKWILRRAVSDRLPASVVNRRKAGFDTPAERWMKTLHRGFVHDILTSERARHRGIFRPQAVASWLATPNRANWFDVSWKMLCVELWARRFLDEAAA